MTDHKRALMDEDGDIWVEYEGRWHSPSFHEGMTREYVQRHHDGVECAVVPLSELGKLEDNELPGYIPEYLYLITADGEWPIYVAEDEAAAIRTAEGRRTGQLGGHRIRITKVRIGGCERLEIQHYVINRKLVPEGTAVTK